jgi:amidase
MDLVEVNRNMLGAVPGRSRFNDRIDALHILMNASGFAATPLSARLAEAGAARLIMRPRASGWADGAAAIAESLADVAVGLDEGGTFIASASAAGLFALRCSAPHRTPNGLLSLIPAVAATGICARALEPLIAVARICADPPLRQPSSQRLLLLDVRGMIEPKAIAALSPVIDELRGRFRTIEPAPIKCGDLEGWRRLAQALAGASIRLDETSTGVAAISRRLVGAMQQQHARIAAGLRQLVGKDGVLCLPAPLGGEGTGAAIAGERLSAIAELAGLPHLLLPVVGTSAGGIGLSLVGPRRSERQLLTLGLDLVG